MDDVDDIGAHASNCQTKRLVVGCQALAAAFVSMAASAMANPSGEDRLTIAIELEWSARQLQELASCFQSLHSILMATVGDVELEDDEEEEES